MELQTRQLTVLQAIQILQAGLEKSQSHLMRAFEAKIEAVQAQVDARFEELRAATDQMSATLPKISERMEAESPRSIENRWRLLKERAARLRLQEGHSVDQIANCLTIGR